MAAAEFYVRPIFVYFKFLRCLGLIDMLSANQNAESFVGILLA